MAINFSIGDKLIVKQQYVQNTLTRLPRNPRLVGVITSLGYFGITSAEVMDVGNAFVFDKGVQSLKSFIKVCALDSLNKNYNNGQGVILYFDTDDLLNNSFEYSTAYLCDVCSRRALNNSGVSIPKLAIVRYTGFDETTQLATIALANATTAASGKVMGMAEEAIADGDIGSIIIEGAISGVDTSTYTINDTIYLSDTPGEITDTPGTVTSIVGRAHTIGDPGSISVKGEFPFGDGGGGGGAGTTGIQGVTGIMGTNGTQGVTGIGAGSGFFTDGAGTDAGVGKGATAPTAGGNNALSQGDGAVADGDNSFAQGQDVSASGEGSFAQGYNSSVLGIYSFVQGYSNTNEADYSFVQGSDNSVSMPTSFAQGQNNTVPSGSGRCNIVVGYGNSTTGAEAYQAAAFGYNNTMNDPQNVFVQGYNNSTDGQNAFSQGSTNYAFGDQIFVQGQDNTWDGSGLENIFAQGDTVTFTGTLSAYQVLAQGRDISVGGETTNTFAQGFNMNVRGSDDSFFQGQNHSTDGFSRARVFMQGAYGETQNDDQKVWGSNRTSVGGAQSNKMVKYLSRSTAGPVSFVTVNIDTDRSYTINARIVARNTTTAGESASFVLSQALVYNDAGTATLVGAPVFTQVDSGGGSSSWAADIAVSGVNFVINITSDASDTVQWCMDLEWVQVAG